MFKGTTETTNKNVTNSKRSPTTAQAEPLGPVEASLRQQQAMRLGIEPQQSQPLRRLIRALTRKKPLDCRTDTNLDRCLNLIDLTALGVGSTLGLGLYVLAGQVAANKAGPAVVLSFAFAALASAFSALCYAEFAGLVPRAGSAYAYSYITVGEFVAFVIGWNLVLEYVIGASSVARGFSGYLVFVYEHVSQALGIGQSTASGLNSTSTSTSSSSPSWGQNSSSTNQSVAGGLSSVVSRQVALHASNSTDSNHFQVDFWSPIWAYLVQYFDATSIAIVLVVTIFILFGVKGSTNVTLAFTTLNLLVVVGVVASSLGSLDLHNWSLAKSEVPAGYGDGGFLPFGWSGVLAGSATCFFGFIGFDTIASSAEEAQNPKRNVPISIILSLAISFVAYMSIALVQTLLWPYYDQNNITILPYIFGRLDMPLTYWLVLLGAIAGLSSSQLGGFYPLPRILYSMAHDKLIYGFLAHINKRLKLPVRATLVGSAFVAILACLLDIQDLADMVSIGTLAAYSLVSLSVLILRYEDRSDAIDDEHPSLRNANLSFANLLVTMEQQQRQTGSLAQLASQANSQHKEPAKEELNMAIERKPSTPIREKGSRPLEAKFSVGFHSWFAGSAEGLPQEVALGSLAELEEPSQPESGKTSATSAAKGKPLERHANTNNQQLDQERHRSTRRQAPTGRQGQNGQDQTYLDLLTGWRHADRPKACRPSGHSSHQSKVLISLLLILSVILNLLALSLSSSLTGSGHEDAQARGQHQAQQQNLALAAMGCLCLVALASVMLMLSRLPVSEPTHPDAFRVPLVPLVPTLSILVNVFLMLNLSYLTWLRFAVWMAVGLFIYFTYGIWKSQGYLLSLDSTPALSSSTSGSDNTTSRVAERNCSS